MRFDLLRLADGIGQFGSARYGYARFGTGKPGALHFDTDPVEYDHFGTVLVASDRSASHRFGYDRFVHVRSASARSVNVRFASVRFVSDPLDCSRDGVRVDRVLLDELPDGLLVNLDSHGFDHGCDRGSRGYSELRGCRDCYVRLDRFGLCIPRSVEKLQFDSVFVGSRWACNRCCGTG